MSPASSDDRDAERMSAAVDDVLQAVGKYGFPDLQTMTVLTAALTICARFLGMSIDDLVNVIRCPDAWESVSEFVGQAQAALRDKVKAPRDGGDERG